MIEIIPVIPSSIVYPRTLPSLVFKSERKRTRDDMPGGHPTPVSAFSWLSKLKATQLHRIAVATGVQSSGTKPVLAQRLSDELQLDRDGSEVTTKAESRKGNREESVDGKGMSILSIDMGIRNLAYAHIIVPPGAPTTFAATTSNGKLDSSIKGDSKSPSPILNAWTRLAVSSFPASAEADKSCLDSPTPKMRKDKKHQPTLADDQVNSLASGQNAETKESFSPQLYASHAYSLIKSLLTTYKPTHILIERQRFRSGGSSAVLEWTIRVGVFEGMLYAVLNTLRREGRIKGLVGADSDADVIVQGVEPRRVAMYWTEGDPKPSSEQKEKEIEEGGKEKKIVKTSRAKEGKKAKINLVANWWLSFLDCKENSRLGNSEPLKISLAEGSQAKGVVDVYLRKWKRGNSSLKRGSIKGGGSGKENHAGEVQVDENPVTKIKKLDDLADCLLQGIAWLEWRGMRRIIARDGPDAVPWLEGSVDKIAEEDTKKTKATRNGPAEKKLRKSRRLKEV